MKFAQKEYGIPKERLEYYPLGGKLVERSNEVRQALRSGLGTSKEKIVFLQVGKIDRNKCLLEALESFEKYPVDNWEYWVAGSIADDVKIKFKAYQEKDTRIKYLGWKNSDEIFELFQAADIYVQPGKVSALAQNAICCGLPVVLRNIEDYRLLVQKNGWLIDGAADLQYVFAQLAAGDADLDEMSRQAYEIAKNVLDYKMLAQKIYR